MPVEQMGLIESLVDQGCSSQELGIAIELMGLEPEERDALELWAWAWAESRPRGFRALRERLVDGLRAVYG